MIVCRTLGPVEVLLDGGLAPAELLWRKNLALLLYLARSPRRSRARDHLMGLLWPEKPQSAARHSLNEAVRVIRRSIGESALDTDARQIRLANDSIRLDVEELEMHAAKAQWSAAAGLISGEFLEGFAVPDSSGFEDWLAAERAHWRARSVEVLVHRAEGQLAAGAAREAAATARRAVKLDPRSDLALRATVRCLALAGERAAALESYESFAARLQAELGVAPQPETAALAERVRRERPPPAAARSGAGVEPRLPLIGRSRELATLLEATDRCRTERRAVWILLAGDPGTGRTRLLEEVLGRLRLDGAIVAAARAVEADREQPWSGVRALARGGLLEARGLGAAPSSALVGFASELPEWADRFGGALGVAPWPPGRALAELLRSAAEEQPVFLAVDDADYLDRDSLLALEAVLRDLSHQPIGVVLTTSGHARQPEIDRVRSRLGRDLAGASVDLGPLAIADLRDLARRFLPTFDEVEIDRVARRVGTDSAGIPLLAVELLRAVALGMDLNATAGAWPEPFRTLDQTLPGDLPGAVVAAVRVGYGQLERRARQALAAASLLPDRFTVETLAAAADFTAQEVIAALDLLEWHRWLVSEPRGYGFAARIVREIIAREMLTTGQRQRILERLLHDGTGDQGLGT
ncbi:MAG TPA: AAA family ATPase [Gemmatimonadales bacterium]